MAIALRGTATAASDQNGGDVTVTMPVGTAQNDLSLAIEFGESSAGNETLSMVTTGYTQLADLFADDTHDANLGVYQKIQGATPDTTAVFTGFGDASEVHLGCVRVYSGVDTTTPIDATTTTTAGSGGPLVNPPSITTVTNNAVVVAMGGAGAGSDATLTAPTGYTDELSFADNDGSLFVRLISAEKLVATAGAEDPGSFGDSGGAQAAMAAATVAVRPAGGGTITAGRRRFSLLGVGHGTI